MGISYGKGIKRPDEYIQPTKEQLHEIIKCGQDPIYFAENFYYIVRPKEGKQKISLYPFQKKLIKSFQTNQKNIVLSARQTGKALDNDTPILTKDKGFVRMGDLQVGDVIYGRDGKETNITFITETMYEHDVYKITFDTGESIYADKEHLWTVSNPDWQRRKNKEETLTTEELIPIYERLKNRKSKASLFINYLENPLTFKHKEVKIHPYLLGLWIGDGNRSQGRITCCLEDYQEYYKILTELGYEVGDFKLDKRTEKTGYFSIKGLKKLLREVSIFKNKHIPDEYLFNSFDNRLSLLKGLMDSDGYVQKDKGMCEFYQSDERIINQVQFLLSSLSIKTRKHKKKTTHKDAHKLTFTTDKFCIFNLERKKIRQSFVKGHPQNKRIYIHDIKKVKSRPVRCLQVDNKDHLFLCGKTLIPTHNTTCSSLFILWMAIFNLDQHIGILANKQKTAKSIVDDVKLAYQMLPDWLKPGVTKYNDLSIEFDNGTKIEAGATSSDSFRGESLSLLFLDEFAFVPENVAEDFWRSTYPTLSTGGKTIIVSTPNGAAGKFYDIYTTSEKGGPDVDFVCHRIDWNEVPGRDEEWKRKTIKEFGKVAFAQEYQCSFTGSNYTLIDGDALTELHHRAVDAPYMLEDGQYQIWKKPEKNRIYAFGIDVSQGTHGDYSVINIYDITDYAKTGIYEQVGLWRRNDVRVFDFAPIVLQLTKDWYEPLVVIENNSGLGEALIQLLYFEEGYEHLFYDYQKGDYGINANKSTKPSALGFFKEDVEEGKMIINSDLLVKELGIFEEQGRSPTGERKFAARKGRSFHDDIVTSSYWVSYMLRDRWFEDAYDYKLELLGQESTAISPLSQDDEETMENFMNAMNQSPLNMEDVQADFERELWED